MPDEQLIKLELTKEEIIDLKKLIDFELINDPEIKFARAQIRSEARKFAWQAQILKEIELTWNSLKNKHNLTKTFEQIFNEFNEKRQKDILDKAQKKEQRIQAALILTDKRTQAKLFLEIQPVFFDNAGLWWIWDLEKKCWKLTDEINILNLIFDNTNEDTINSKERNEILSALEQESRRLKPKPAPKTWIQFKNGIVDISKERPEELIEPTPEYFITNPLPYNLGDNCLTTKIDELFQQWAGEENVNLLYEIIAYCMLSDYPIHRLFCLIGPGSNGKGTYLRMITKFLGPENCTSVELDRLLTSNFIITKLHKKLICQMGETNFNEMSKTSMLKSLTGGDLIGFEYKNKTPFDDYNYAKIIISTNSLPTTTDKTIGFYRRWNLIDFPNQFDEKEDPLDYIFDEEYENLGYRLIFILKDLLKRRSFTNDGSIEERKKKYEDHSNYFDKFLNEFIIEDFEGNIGKSDFKNKFTDWCKENKHREMSDVTIAKNMKEKNIETQRVTMFWVDPGPGGEKPRYMAWQGIKWK